MTANQKASALYCTIALGCLQALYETEQPKSARHNRLSGAIDAINRAVDIYRLESFEFEDMSKAGKLLDLINDEIFRLYPKECE